MYEGVSDFDKLAHVVLFGGVAFLAALNMNGGGKVFFVAATLTSFFAGLIELAQGLLPFRTAEWWDLWAGVIGACAGALLASTVPRAAQQRRS
jgi:VanZ family protein